MGRYPRRFGVRLDRHLELHIQIRRILTVRPRTIYDHVLVFQADLPPVDASVFGVFERMPGYRQWSLQIRIVQHSHDLVSIHTLLHGTVACT